METNRASRLLAVISQETGVDPREISRKTTFRSLCTDSLELVSLIQAIEENLGVDIDDPDKFLTVGDALAYADSRS